MGPVIGIDFGTTNSVVAVMENGQPQVICGPSGDRLVPSAVAFTRDSRVLVGQQAKNQAVINAERTFLSIKRQMGTDYRSRIDGTTYRPQMIGAMILRHLRQNAEQVLGTQISQAVITVPAYFSDSQRQAVKEAGELAGLEVIRIVNEPTAAALAYGIRDQQQTERIAVFDLGGGTYDISILEVCEGVVEVLATSGNNHLGGDDFDQALIDSIADEFKQREGIDLRSDRMALQKLREDVEKAKVMLSEASEISISIPFITADNTGPKHLDVRISRERFEQLIADLARRLIPPARQALQDAGLSSDDLDRVLLVGGSTRIPLVQQVIERFTGKPLSRGVNPVECVAVGAAVQAGILQGQIRELILVDIAPLTLGIETEGDRFVPIIDRNSAIPCANSKTFTTISDNQGIVEVHVLQGESERASENISLGKFQLKGVRPAPRGEPRIEVMFSIDADGIVSVSASDMDTGAAQEIAIKDFNRLSAAQMRMQMRHIEQKMSANTG